MHVTLELRNLPRNRVLAYLREAGGRDVALQRVQGDGWTASLESMAAAQVGALTIPRAQLVIAGDAGAVRRIAAFMRYKTMRGGG